MGATRFLTSESLDPRRDAAPGPGKTGLVASRQELALAIATLSSAKPTRPGALVLPAVAHALVAHAGSLSVPEYAHAADASGRKAAVATGRRLTGLQALQALHAGFGANNAFRRVELDDAAIGRSNALAIPGEARLNEQRLEEAKGQSAKRDPLARGAPTRWAPPPARDPSSRAARWNDQDDYLRGR